MLLVPVILCALVKGDNLDAFIDAIRKEAEALGKEKFQFSQDVVLKQNVGGDGTLYVRADGSKGGATVFKRKGSDDQGKTVIILKAGEDHLQRTEEKRTFVVLRQTFDEPQNYYVLYAYVR